MLPEVMVKVVCSYPAKDTANWCGLFGNHCNM